jgi:hypothetical protein
MHVKMEHGLASDLSVVGKNIEPFQLQTIDKRVRNDLCRMQYVVQVRLRDVKKIEAVLFRDNESVAVVNRVDIKNSKNITVLVQDLSRQFMLHDLTENAIHSEKETFLDALFVRHS